MRLIAALGATLLCGVLQAWAGPQCILVPSEIRAPKADPAAARLEIYADVGDLAQAALDALGDRAAQKDIREAVAAQSPRIIDELLWSGRPGALIHVRMQETMPSPNVTPPPSFLDAVFVGTGTCAMNVLVDALDGGPPMMLAGPAANMQVSPAASFYLWASLAEQRELRLSVIAPAALYLNRAAVEQAANRDLSAAARQSRELELLAALAQRAKELEASQPLRESIEQSLQRLEASAQSRRAIETKLSAALESERVANGALAWLDVATKIFAVAQLAVQVDAMLDPSTPVDVRSGIKKAGTAQDAAALRRVVDDYAKARAAMVLADRAALEAMAQAYRAQKAAITEEARKKGAPPVLIGNPGPLY